MNYGVIGELKKTSYLDYKVIILNIVSFLAGIFFSRCGIKGVIFPFGQAYFICMLSYTLYYKSAYMGCLVGWITLFDSIPFAPVFATSLTYISVLVAQKKYKFDLVNFLKVSFVISTILSILIFKAKFKYYLIIGIAEGIISIVNLFVLDRTANVLFIRRKRTALTDDEAVCVVFCLCTFVISFCGKGFLSIDFGMVLAGLITMTFAFLFGGLVGAASGLIMGLCISLGGGTIYAMGSMGVCGFACGMVKKYGRFSCVLTYIITNAVLTLYINGSSFTILPIQNSLASGSIFLLTPNYGIDYLRNILCNTLTKSNEEKYYYEKCNELARNRIQNISRLFSNMSELFMTRGMLKMPKDISISTVIDKACNYSCISCERYDKCWSENFFDTYGKFEDMVVRYNKYGDFKGIRLKCHDDALVQKGIIKALRSLSSEEKLEKKISESKSFMSKQLGEIAGVLNNLNSEIKSNVRFEKDIERNIKEELLMHSFMVHDVCVLNVASSLKCEVVVNGCNGDRACKKKIEPIVSKYCGKSMLLDGNLCNFSSKKRCTLVFRESKPIKVSSCVSQFSKEDVCGDSYNITYITDNKYMMCLSDGMGAGKRAKEESSACVSLIEDFLKAGFEDSVVFSTVNKLLLIKNTEDMFTTVDMCVVDLVRQKADFTKIGAVPSYILKKDKGVSIIHGNSLPLGILDDVEPKTFQKDIEEGDILIMFTDGVFDRFGGIENIQNIDDILQKIVKDKTDPKDISNSILTYAKNKNTDMELDDMTVLVSVFKKC